MTRNVMKMQMVNNILRKSGVVGAAEGNAVDESVVAVVEDYCYSCSFHLNDDDS